MQLYTIAYSHLCARCLRAVVLSPLSVASPSGRHRFYWRSEVTLRRFFPCRPIGTVVQFVAGRLSHVIKRSVERNPRAHPDQHVCAQAVAGGPVVMPIVTLNIGHSFVTAPFLVSRGI